MLQSIFGFFFVAVVAVVVSSPLVPETQPAAVDGWNALLGPRSFFDENVNTIQTKSTDDAVILGQFKQLLSQDEVMTPAYLKYRTIFEKTNEASRERLNQLKKSMIAVARHNLEAAAGKHSWTMAINNFADMSPAELKRWAGSYVELDNSTQTAVPVPYEPKPGAAALPASVDYENIMTSVKSQGSCGTCVMFAAIAVLEAADARANSRKAIDLSPQELADCYTKKHFTCEETGSDTRTNLEHLVQHGVASLADYPYTGDKGVVGPCKKDSTPRAAKALSYEIKRVEIQSHTEESLKQALVDGGPVTMALQFNDDYGAPWFQIHKGVYTGESCDPKGKTSHTVALVGYGEEDGIKYWKFKNSYGADWGEAGYGKIKMGVCLSLARVASIVAKPLPL